MYKCTILSNDYSEWKYEPDNHELDNPIQYKLFHGDQFTHQKDGTIELVDSPVRHDQNIPGILILEKNLTYGRTENGKRLYYQCKPNDPHLPIFLVPYNFTMGFSKNFKNKYVTFRYTHWNDTHPIGLLTQNFGDVFDLHAFNEYQLYCKHLQSSLAPATSLTKKALKSRSVSSFQEEIMNNPAKYGDFTRLFEDNHFTFSVDPFGCKDRDDALTIISSLDREIAEFKVTVHIANVWVWIESLGLSEHLGNRVASIYFPEITRPMLPTGIGEKLCSLDEGELRFAFSMDFTVFEHPKKGVFIQYLESVRPNMYQSIIRVSKNYVYEEPTLLNNIYYKSLFGLTKKLEFGIKNSHDVVAFWMTQMNSYVAKHMKKERFGIYRTVQSKNNHDHAVSDDLPPIVRIIEQQYVGEYVVYENKQQNIKHASLGLSEYVHFTSPIRRMPDLLNQIAWMKYHVGNVALSTSLLAFYDNQLNHMDVLNQKMKNIRKIQAEAHILHAVTNQPTILEQQYDGIILACVREDKYTIYIEQLNWLCQCVMSSKEVFKVYDKVKCKLFVFEKEDKLRRKIRIQIV